MILFFLLQFQKNSCVHQQHLKQICPHKKVNAGTHQSGDMLDSVVRVSRWVGYVADVGTDPFQWAGPCPGDVKQLRRTEDSLSQSTVAPGTVSAVRSGQWVRCKVQSLSKCT